MTETIAYTVDDDQLRAVLSDLISAEGTQTAAARKLGITQTYLGDIIHGRRDIAALAGRLGYKSLTVFVPNGEPEIDSSTAARVIEALRRRRMAEARS